MYQQGAVEKSRQRRSHQFSVLTYWKCAPRAKLAAALLNELFLTARMSQASNVSVGLFACEKK